MRTCVTCADVIGHDPTVLIITRKLADDMVEPTKEGVHIYTDTMRSLWKIYS